MDELPIQSGDDVVRVRQHVRNAAASSGLSLVDQTKLVTAASELARNTLVHGGGGVARVEVVKSPAGRAGIKLHFADEGPGIADVNLALTDGWSSGTGLGLGLSGSRRLVDEFELTSEPAPGPASSSLSGHGETDADLPGAGGSALAPGRGSERRRRLPRRRHGAGRPPGVPGRPQRPIGAGGDGGGVQPAQARQPGVDAAAHHPGRETPGIEMVTIDGGPGLRDAGAAMRDGHSTSGTLGIGLGAIARLADFCDLYSVPGHGTVLVARFWPEPRSGTDSCAGLARPIEGETECGDVFAVEESEGTLTGVLCDGLGHGPLAAIAASEAVRAVLDGPAGDPAAAVARAHGRMGQPAAARSRWCR